MPALDTNALVRYVVQDDEVQVAAARRLIRKHVREQRTLFVPVTVALELEWVLRSNFGDSKGQTIEALSNLLSATELTFESERALELALKLYRKGSAGFADCLGIALAAQAGEQRLRAFDKSAVTVSGAQLVGR